MILSLGLIMFHCCTSHVFVHVYGAPTDTSGLQAKTVCTTQSTDNGRQGVIMSKWMGLSVGAMRVHAMLKRVRKDIVEIPTVLSSQLLSNEFPFLWLHSSLAQAIPISDPNDCTCFLTISLTHMFFQAIVLRYDLHTRTFTSFKVN